ASRRGSSPAPGGGRAVRDRTASAMPDMVREKLHRPGRRPVSSAFDDVLAANEDYVRSFDLAGLQPVAARGLALVTCMDSRIEPLDMLGLKPGDAKILRNAGARVTDDTLRTLVLAVYLLGVNRVIVLPHTRCK